MPANPHEAGQAPSAEARAEYERELARKLAQLLVAGWRRRHGASAEALKAESRPGEELPPAA